MTDTTDATVSESGVDGEPTEVLCVDDDPDFLDPIETHLSGNGDFDVRTETDPTAVVGRVDSVDCIVSDYDTAGLNGLKLLRSVRERAPTLPFVLCTGSSQDELAAGLPEEVWTEMVPKSDLRVTASVLADRIRRLVGHWRTFQTAKRSLTAVEVTDDGVAVVSPNGEFTFVNYVFASQFGARPDALVGQPWQTRFPDEEVERLRSTALQTVRDDWQWTGGCRCLADDGETFATQTRVAGLDDGSFVFCLTGIEAE